MAAKRKRAVPKPAVAAKPEVVSKPEDHEPSVICYDDFSAQVGKMATIVCLCDARFHGETFEMAGEAFDEHLELHGVE